MPHTCSDQTGTDASEQNRNVWRKSNTRFSTWLRTPLQIRPEPTRQNRTEMSEGNQIHAFLPDCAHLFRSDRNRRVRSHPNRSRILWKIFFLIVLMVRRGCACAEGGERLMSFTSLLIMYLLSASIQGFQEEALLLKINRNTVYDYSTRLWKNK